MTTLADVPTDEEAFTACLAGRPVPPGARGLAAFTDAVRASATAPGRPNAALAELLATGLLTDQSEPSTRTTGHPARASRKRPRMLLSTLTAKFAAAGIAAKAACATGAVAVALTGAAATASAMTPEDGTAVVQDDVSDTTGGTGEVAGTPEAGTPEAGTPEAGTPEPGAPEVETPVAGTPVAETPEAKTPVAEEPVTTAPEPTDDELAAEWAEGPATGQSHGSWVSEGARNGWVTGQDVSDAAHARNEQRREDRAQAAQPEADEPAELPAAPAPADEEPTVTTTGGNGHGNGNAGGNGNGRR